jgi:hypothetical protein
MGLSGRQSLIGLKGLSSSQSPFGLKGQWFAHKTKRTKSLLLPSPLLRPLLTHVHGSKRKTVTAQTRGPKSLKTRKYSSCSCVSVHRTAAVRSRAVCGGTWLQYPLVDADTQVRVQIRYHLQLVRKQMIRRECVSRDFEKSRVVASRATRELTHRATLLQPTIRLFIADTCRCCLREHSFSFSAPS